MRELPILAVLGHALRSTISNLRFAWHLSWPWLAILTAIQLLIVWMFPVMEAGAPQDNSAAFTAQFLHGIFSVFAFSSIAVAWHRYVLRDEVPTGAARLRLDSVVLRYFGESLLVGLIVGLAVMPVVFIISFFSIAFGIPPDSLAAVTVIAAAAVGLPLAYRLLLKLPAIALGDASFTFRAALERTKGNAVRLGLAAAIVIICVLLIGFLMFGALDTIAGSGPASRVVSVLVEQGISWITTIFTITFLTSLYGFFVEGRDF